MKFKYQNPKVQLNNIQVVKLNSTMAPKCKPKNKKEFTYKEENKYELSQREKRVKE